jgi:hypothetical protein
MKKTLILMAVIAAFSTSLHAQKAKSKAQSTTTTPSSYIGLSTGINNIAGFAGLTFELPFTPNFSGKIGAGIGAWGVKLGLAGKYYANFPESWSFGAGYSTASGIKNVDLDLGNGSSTQKIKMNLDRAHNLDLVIGKAWGEKIKFNIEFGYAVRISGGTYEPVNKSEILSADSKRVLDVLSPDGLIFGMGIAFRL